MLNPNDPTAIPTVPRGRDGSPNGKPHSLADRVRSLRLPERATKPPPSRPARLPWLLCLFFAGTTGYLATRPAPEAVGPPPESAATTALPGPGPESRPALKSIDSGGFIVPVRRIQISPKVGGQVTRLFFQEGERVEAGEPLALIDRTKFAFAYLRATSQAELARAEYDKQFHGNRAEEKMQAEAALREAEAMRDQARDELRRLRTATTATSKEELVRADSRVRQTEYRVRQLGQANRLMQIGPRQEDIDRAWHNYQNALALCDDARYDYDSTVVIAPVGGVILKKYAEEGNMVRPEAYSNGLSASLYDLADLTQLEVDVDVSERDIEAVFKGQPCEVRPEAFARKTYAGEVSRLMPEAVRSKGSIPVRVRILIPEGDTLLRPEMRARVRFLAPLPPTRKPGDGARQGDKETRRQGDKETRRQGDKETRRTGDDNKQLQTMIPGRA